MFHVKWNWWNIYSHFQMRCYTGCQWRTMKLMAGGGVYLNQFGGRKVVEPYRILFKKEAMQKQQQQQQQQQQQIGSLDKSRE